MFPDLSELTEDIDAFQTSLKLSKDRPRYTFYDGPPFATGLPHYGHILASAIKDTITRYAHATGHYVERRFGWDTHGLPIEHEIDKLLGIKCKEDVLKIGIKTYNDACREIVMRYAFEWKITIERMGRWIDFDNDYKTLYPSFMESEWWAFKELYKKGLVYRGFKVMPYSNACTTPLSNFEAGQNYQNVSDPSSIVAFKLVDQPDVSILAWTSTPWTLPSNLALCVNPDFIYIKFKDEQGRIFISLESRLCMLYNNVPKANIEILERIPAKDMVGWKYEPLFKYFTDKFGDFAFKIVADSYVISSEGTGIVHQAPAFGEDDYRICTAYNIISPDMPPPCPIDEAGHFTSQVPDFEGQYIKDANKEIQRILKSQGKLIVQTTFVHSYPFCWRSDTPLIYRTIPSWFIKVQGHNDKLN